MKTIEERAKEYAPGTSNSDSLFPTRISTLAAIERRGYIAGATEQKAIDIDKACNIFCHTGCPHKTDSYNCLNDKCDTWKVFKRMIEEEK